MAAAAVAAAGGRSHWQRVLRTSQVTQRQAAAGETNGAAVSVSAKSPHQWPTRGTRSHLSGLLLGARPLLLGPVRHQLVKGHGRRAAGEAYVHHAVHLGGPQGELVLCSRVPGGTASTRRGKEKESMHEAAGYAAATRGIPRLSPSDGTHIWPLAPPPPPPPKAAAPIRSTWSWITSAVVMYSRRWRCCGRCGARTDAEADLS